jgi:RsiW-degrading membrane proteinase PrsW (M82 family)
MPNSSILKKLNWAGYFVLLIPMGLILPMILIPMVQLFSIQSEIIEEVAKALIILFLVTRIKGKIEYLGALIFGLTFGVSENFLYLSNFIQNGGVNLFWERFLFTVPMHVITSILILFFIRINRNAIILGILLSIVLHLLFNTYVKPI